ncbi:DUF3347 domain-containing protein [Brumimicrobium aurantiacum]|uniref:DUF3347 domain-containing protein n=1 Tax=Brumimicrobium aurantiacum TaxID=1737063 RepID=A0A3E1EUA0_9FLAO|nr:DUF3347 domain-containing protein [Brumimicrobium aurantiacum]
MCLECAIVEEEDWEEIKRNNSIKSREIRNLYYGDAMLKCGEVKEVIGK